MRVLIALLFLGALALPATIDLSAQMQEPEIGVTAPAFTLPDSYGNDLSLSDYSGQWVVLEWLNYGCPSYRSTTAVATCRSSKAIGVLLYNGAIDDLPTTQPYGCSVKYK